MTPKKFNPLTDLPSSSDQKPTPDEVPEKDMELNIDPGTYEEIPPTMDTPATASVTITPEPRPETMLENRLILEAEQKKAEEERKAREEKQKKDRERTLIENIIVGIIVGLLFVIAIVALRFLPTFLGSISSLFANRNNTVATSTVATSTTETRTAYVVPVQTTKPAATSTSYITYNSTTTPTNTSTGRADLSVKIVSVNTFAGRTSVRFNVQNIGGTTSGAWTFSVTLPSTADPIYYSIIQAPITPLSGVIYTLGFDTMPLIRQNNQISIRIFPPITDANRNNNSASYLIY